MSFTSCWRAVGCSVRWSCLSSSSSSLGSVGVAQGGKGWGMAGHKIQKRAFYVKKTAVAEEAILKECSLIINSNPTFASELFDKLNRGGREAMSRKIFRDHIRRKQMPPDLVLKEFCRITGRDPDTEFRKADKNQDGTVSDNEFKEWSSEHLLKSRAEDAPTEPTKDLTSRQQYAVFINQMVPFLGFGFMDNAIMIMAGDKIDMTLGMSLGISTMAAAGLGNLISDVCGVGFGGAIESVSQKIGLPSADLSAGQRELPRVRLLSAGGQVMGIAVGCLIGMIPLLWLNQEERKLKAIFDSFDVDGNGFIDVEEIWESLEASGIDLPLSTVESIVEALDSQNRDGKLEFEEFKEFMARLQRILGHKTDAEVAKYFKNK
eukprot:CAMPEP_0201510012 /NCGR_PEP_ID=MMETSP0161_2-20130828/2885_1 /ASSEMBLY_ACC=CAM_ASM_000251 /TAXON_ID=180227 /ORGANISM="Neoparamoeba aestuarina, Strain SoJaBio B1-5/56/2" /LENGTH=375 /DNA_ID=CAMNT_0047905125 /DNA_START=72 /DNA_END=1196 /DNA_ORIENTATION=-